MKISNILSPTHAVILTSPTCCGKHYFQQQTINRHGLGSTPPPIVTTRPPRAQLDDYNDAGHFHISHRLFSALMCADALVEYNLAGAYNYGTPHTIEVDGQQIMIYALDADTAARFRDEVGPYVTVIGIVPRNKEVMRQRLDARHVASAELVEDRLKKAYHDICRIARVSDYILSSDDNGDQVLEQLDIILRSCALKVPQQRQIVIDVLRSFEI